MIRLLALGQCGIELDGKRVSAESEVVFGLLLYLAARAGDAVSRDELQAMFWPELHHTRGRHCLRQVAYRLRQLGVRLGSDNASLGVSVEDVSLDFAVFMADAVPAAQFRGATIGDILPGYQPSFSAPFSRWVEDYRTVIGARLRQGLVSAIIDLRSKGRYREVEPLARACLAGDPLNEVATLTLAEATAVLSGNRAEAMAILDRYIDEIGETPEKRLALSASILRRRIGERFVEQRYAAPPEPPFVGREDLLELLVEKLQQAVAGRESLVYLWGEAGIGKTRLLDELAKVAHVHGIRVERYNTSPNDPDRPLALFLALLPHLLQMQGAAGVSPEGYEALHRFVEPATRERGETPSSASEAAHLFGRLKASIRELIDALSEERPLALLIDDAHWSDPRSLEVLSELVEVGSDQRRVLFVITSREGIGGISFGRLDSICARATVRRLSGLAPSEIETLLARIAAQRNYVLTPEFVRRTADRSAGNPLFVSELATHYGCYGVRDDLPHNMQTLLERRLSILGPGPLLLFQSCAIAGEHGTVERIAEMLGAPVSELALQLQEIETAGLITTSGANVLCRHELLAREAVRRLTPSIAAMLHWSFANVLRKELEECLDLRLAHACLRHLVDAHQQSGGVKLAVEIARRLLDNGATEDARELIGSAEALGPTGRDQGEVLALRLRAARAAADWHDLNLALADYSKLTTPVDCIDDAELRAMAFEARTYSGESTSRNVAPLIALLNSGDLLVSERKRVAVNALIACCDSFDTKSAGHIFESTFRPASSPLASVDDLVGSLLYHTSFGSLDSAVDVAHTIVRQLSQTKRHGHRETQLLRWCAAPFHFVGDETESKTLLSESRELARVRGLTGEIQIGRMHESFSSLDLEDLQRARECIWRLLAAPLAPSAFSESTVRLLELRLAVLENDAQAAAKALKTLELCRVPDCLRVHFNIKACRVRVSALTNSVCDSADLHAILSAPVEALSAIEMDWVVAAACAYALKNDEHLPAAHVLLERFVPVRRARFPLPLIVRHLRATRHPVDVTRGALC